MSQISDAYRGLQLGNRWDACPEVGPLRRPAAGRRLRVLPAVPQRPAVRLHPHRPDAARLRLGQRAVPRRRLHDRGRRPQRRDRPGRTARPRLRRLLRPRRLLGGAVRIARRRRSLRSIADAFGLSDELGGPVRGLHPDRDRDRADRRRDPRRADAAAARRLPRHRDPGLRRDHPHHRRATSTASPAAPTGITSVPVPPGPGDRRARRSSTPSTPSAGTGWRSSSSSC